MMNVRLAPRAWIPLAAGGVAAAAIGVALITVGPLAPADGPGAATPASSGATPTPNESPADLQPTVVALVLPDSGFAVAREESIDNDTALARMESPRTGETWHAPIERPEYAEAFASYDEVVQAESYFSIGERGGFDIVVAGRIVEPESYYDSPAALGWLTLWGGFFEMRGGVPVLITSPWESPGTCADYFSWHLDFYPQLVGDADVFYDSLSYPTALAVGPGTNVTLHTWADWTDGCQFGFPGTPLPWERDFGSADVADAVDQGLTELAGDGPVDLVRLEWPSQVTGLVNGQYFVRTPFDTLMTTYFSGPAAGGFGDVSWVAGQAPANPGDDSWRGISPAAGDTCWDPTQFTREINHVDADWVLAGTSATGVDLYVPVDGGNPVALSVYTRMSDKSSYEGWGDVGPWSTSRPLVGKGRVATEEVPPYAYATYEAFLADNALLAYEDSPGSWLLVVRGTALYSVYECS